MKELNDEMVTEVKEYYKKYKLFISQKESNTLHNRNMKSDFITIHFEDEEAEDKKRIKKEITRLFDTITAISSGSDPVLEVKSVRKSHLDLSDEMWDELMEIYNKTMKNKENSEEIDGKVEKDILIPVGLLMGTSSDVAGGIFKLWRDTEVGKFPITLNVADGYRAIIQKVGNN